MRLGLLGGPIFAWFFRLHSNCIASERTILCMLPNARETCSPGRRGSETLGFLSGIHALDSSGLPNLLNLVAPLEGDIGDIGGSI